MLKPRAMAAEYLTTGEAGSSVVPVYSPQGLCTPFRKRDDLIPRLSGGFLYSRRLTRARPWAPNGLFAFRRSPTAGGETRASGLPSACCRESVRYPIDFSPAHVSAANGRCCDRPASRLRPALIGAPYWRHIQFTSERKTRAVVPPGLTRC